MIYKANGVESSGVGGLEMYSNEDFKENFPDAGNIKISCKSSYHQNSKNVDLFDFQNKELKEVIYGGFFNDCVNNNQSDKIKDVEKEIEYSSDDKKDKYIKGEITKINKNLQQFLNKQENSFNETFKSYVESKTIYNQSDQMRQNIAPDNKEHYESADILIEKYNLAKKSIYNKSSKQPDNKFKPKNINQNNQSNEQI